MPAPRLHASLAAGVLFLASVAHAGPPFVTDDPEPVEHGHWEVNYALGRTWHDGSTSTALPTVDINYGVAPDVQLHAQPRYAIETDAHGRQAGIDDTEIGVKYRFLHRENGETSFMAGIYPMLQLPTGRRRLGDGRRRLQSFLPLWIQLGSGAWTAYGGFGYRINQGPQNRNSVFTGATLLYQLRPWLQLGGEVVHETAVAFDSPVTSAFNLGARIALIPNYNLLLSGGKNLNTGASPGQRALFVALQVLN